MTENEFVFQIISWKPCNKKDESNNLRFEVKLFGMTQDNKTVFLNLTGFKPYFYVKIPKKWNKLKATQLLDTAKEELYPNFLKKDLFSMEIAENKIFKEFDDYEIYKFMKLEFNNVGTMRAFEKVFNKKLSNKNLSKKPIKYELFESNAEPMLKCMHSRNILSCGWVKVDRKYLRELDDFSHCDYSYEVPYKKINPYDSNDIRPFIVASFDIECISEEMVFPIAEKPNDKVIQIGTTFNKCGESDCYRKNIITLGTCDPIKGVEVIECKTEKQVLLEWTKLIQESDPDIITGYNIFGFDFSYLYKRAKLLNIEDEFSKLSRIKYESCRFIEKSLSSSALGDNFLKYYDMIGRVPIDLMKVVQRDFKLPSYKLDSVASSFIRENINEIIPFDGKKKSLIKTKNTFGLEEDQYIVIYYKKGYIDYKFRDAKKFKISNLKKDSFEIDDVIHKSDLDEGNYFWTQAKDDVPPKEIFKLQLGSSSDRARIAKYCIMDCVLVNKLMAKLQVLVNGIGMANVSNVPLEYLFLRGQGIKIFSLMLKKCNEKNYVIPVIKKKNKDFVQERLFRDKSDMNDNIEDESDGDDEGYEGATVFHPDKGIHYEPIPVLDYSSLYPSSMIHRNISHDCYVSEEKYEEYKKEGKLKELREKYYFNKVKFRGVGDNAEKETTCYFVKAKDGSMGVLPEILKELLSTRKAVKKLMNAEKEPFKKAILEGLQLAYKLTANSTYGQTGAGTSAIYKREVAASTTATGRELLTYAKAFTENIFSMIVDLIARKKKKTYKRKMLKLFDRVNLDNETTEVLDSIFGEMWINDKRFIDKGGKFNNKDEFIEWFYYEVKKSIGEFRINPKIMYGDTDSVFIKMNLYDPITNKKKTDHDALVRCIDLGILSGILINKVMPEPHDLEYEKTFWPFLIITKKRYVGNLYEEDPNKFKEKSMGIVLKRRDNAPVVKLVCGGIVNKILNERSGKLAVEFTINSLKDILSGKYDLDKFVITKTLKGGYKDRTKITHAVLADRIKTRQPGNEPQSNDRVPFVFVEEKHITCDISGDPVDIDCCKCRDCFGTFSLKYLHNHHKYCTPLCRITRNTNKDEIIKCNICRAWYEKGYVYFRHLLPQKTEPEILGAEIYTEVRKKYFSLLKKDKNDEIKKELKKYCSNTKLLNMLNQNTCYTLKKKYFELNESEEILKYNNYWNHLKNIYEFMSEKFFLDEILLKDYSPFQLYFAFEHANKYEQSKVLLNMLNKINEYVIESNDYRYFRDKCGCKNPLSQKILQGDRAELPEYIIENNLSIDYLYYIKKQIEKPATQFLELVVKDPENIFKTYETIELNRRNGRIPLNNFKKEKEKGIDIDSINTKDITIKKRKKKPVKKKIKKPIIKPTNIKVENLFD